MTYTSPYNANPELVEMKEDIAKRKFNLNVTQFVIGGLVLAATIAASIAFLPALLPASLAASGSGLMTAGMIGVYAGMFTSAVATDFVTMKEREKLKIDEQYVDSYLQGKNHWGKGYREEVAEHGYSLMGANVPVQSKDIAKQR